MSAASLRFDHEKLPNTTLDGDRVVVGRGKECDIRIPSERISGQHAELFLRDDRWWIRDLGSKNGTHVDGAPCADVLPLRPGCRVLIGHVYATFEGATESPAVAKGAATGEAKPILVPARKAPRRRGGMNPMWAAVFVVVVLGGTVVYLKETSSGGPPEDPPLVAREGQEGDSTNSPGSDPWTSSLSGRDDETRTETDADALDRIQRLRGRVSEDGPAPMSTAADTPDDSNPDREDRDEPRDSRRDSSKRGDGRRDGGRPDDELRNQPRSPDPEPKQPPSGPKAKRPPEPSPPDENDEGDSKAPPPPDPLEEALASGDALLIARLVKDSSGPLVKEAKRRLQEETTYCLTRSGALGRGDAILLEAFGLHCLPRDRTQLKSLVPKVQIEEWKLVTRYSQLYTEGLGRKIGSRRMPPHPKRVTIELSPTGGGEALKLEGKTPRIAPRELPDSGHTEEEIWRLTLEPLLGPLRSRLGI